MQRDPLTSLGQAALTQGAVLARTHDGLTVTLLAGPIDCPYCLRGLRAGPGVQAVAFPVNTDETGAVSSIAAGRSGEMMVVTRQGLAGAADEPATLVVVDRNALVVDLACRMLGRPTTCAPGNVTDLHDTVWLDRMVETCLAAPLGEPPSLSRLLSLHPSAQCLSAQNPGGRHGAGSQPPTAEALRHLRSRPDADWHGLHAAACDHGVAWAGIGPALASWFDPGSLARCLFAMLPERDVMLDELGELVGWAAHSAICEVLECSLSS